MGEGGSYKMSEKEAKDSSWGSDVIVPIDVPSGVFENLAQKKLRWL